MDSCFWVDKMIFFFFLKKKSGIFNFYIDNYYFSKK